MQTSLNRNEKMIALLALVALLGVILTFLHINFRTSPSVSQIDTRSQINYKMARPEEGYSEYSLDGREIDRTYEGLVSKQAKAAKKDALAKPIAVAAKSDSKKIEAAKKAAQAQTQARSAQSAAQAKRLVDAKANQSPRNAYGKQEDSNPSVADTSPRDRVVLPAAAQAAPPIAADPASAQPKKKTYAEWRSLIFAKPTQEAINAFLAAYHKGDVTATEVQAMSQDLIDQNSESLKGLGLYALRATPSLASFSQMVHVETEMSATLKTYIQQAYISYLQPQNVGYLNQALQTKDKVLVLKSLNLLSVNLQKVTKGDYTSFTDPRNGRDSAAPDVVPLSNFSGLVAALTTLGSSQDSELAPLAQQVVSYIQSSNHVARN